MDLQLMKGIALGTAPTGERIASVEPGVRIRDLYAFLSSHGYILPCGTCPTVGIGGITLSGGIGYLTRKYGLTLDSLIGAEMVLADGSIVIASEKSHPDLFWAIRGGGGSFGCVTKYIFRVYDGNIPALRFSITWTIPEGARDGPLFLAFILNEWQSWAYEAPDEMTCSAEIYPDSIECAGLLVSIPGSNEDLRAKFTRMVEPILREGSTSISMEMMSMAQGVQDLENKVTFSPSFKM